MKTINRWFAPAKLRRLMISIGSVGCAGLMLSGQTGGAATMNFVEQAGACPSAFNSEYKFMGETYAIGINCFGSSWVVGGIEFESGISGGGTMTASGSSVMDFVFASVGTYDCGYVTYINGAQVGSVSENPYGAKSYSFTFSIEATNRLFDLGGDVSKGNGRYSMPADGHSQAVPYRTDGGSGSITWTITAAPGVATSDANGVITAGKVPGTVKIHASEGSKCTDILLDISDCECCQTGSCPSPTAPGVSQPTLKNSIDYRLQLGWALGGGTAGFLHIKEGLPGPLLATPQTLQYNFAKMDVRKVTDNFGLRQVRTPDCLADITTNTAYSYKIALHYSTNIYSYNGSTYTLKGGATPFQTVVVTNLNSDTNKLRIIETRDGTDTVFDYSWITNGWELSSGGGLRVETKTEVLSETNTLRTSTHLIKNGGGTIIHQHIEKWRTNSTYGERLIEEVTGTGPNALTNTFSWTSAGRLQQANRADGSWEFIIYDSSNRPTNVFSSYRNQDFTTNKSLCRFVEHSYSTNEISGSGDAGYLNTTTPRRTVEYLLGEEVTRRYYVALPNERREIHCVHPGTAWNNSSNLVTVTKLSTNTFYYNEPISVLRPDGTIEIFQNDRPMAFSSYGTITNVVLNGHPNDSNGTNIDDGTKTISIIDWKGKLVSRTVKDVASDITLASETYSYDGFKRLTNTVYLDGTSASSVYKDCCNASFTIDREGTLTTNTLDALRRVMTSKRNGIISSNVYDAAGNVLSTVRIGTNNTAITIGSATFDDAERQMSSTDALGNASSYTNYINGSGQTVKVTTYPNSSTRIETYNRDGSLASVTGTAVHGLRYEYGVETDGGVYRAYSKEIKLDSGGSDTSEWVKNYTDAVGRSYKMVYPDNAFSETFYNTNGQTVRMVDPDGVTTLSQYNLLGELEYSAIDINTNGTIDLSGTDRITRIVNVVTNNGVKDVRRTSTYVWGTTNLDASTLISVTETSTDGLRSWNMSYGLTNQTRTVYSVGHRYVTNTAPDGSFTVVDNEGGRPLSVIRRDSSGAQLSGTTHGYDPHGRLSLVSDARIGTTTNSFDDADRVISVSTPAPASGQASQVTSMTYNNMGWVTTNTQPDGGVVTTVFHLTGERATNSGSRTYPVAYTYDYVGRLKTMTTWTNFATSAGAALTEWKYNGQRGWLTNKVYADGNGPSYTYTPAARLSTRVWARGNTTTYGHNTAGELNSIDYSDSTTDVTHVFDRRGRTIQTTGATTLTALFDDAGNLLSESHDSLTVTNRYDTLLRRTNLQFQVSGVALFDHGYSYDYASRLSSVAFGTNSATYGYLTNSALVDTLTFKNGSTTRMTTSNRYDNLNRLLLKDSRAGSTPVATFNHTYNTANQRTAITNADNSRWSYGYDTLGQVTSGKRYWSDGSVVAGQQFEYSFDDIGNRLSAASGGDEWGGNLRFQNYSANNLNQYSQRTVPPYVDVQGSAHSNAVVTVNTESTYRKGEYFRKELSADNTSGPLWFGVTNVAVLTNGGGPDIVTTNQGNILVAKATESFSFDLDGNQTSDSLWTNAWNGENRLIATESASGVPSAGKAKESWTHLPDGRWIERVLYSWNGSAYVAQSTNRFIWDGQVLVAILDHTNGLVSSFVRGLDLSGSLQGAGGVGGVIAVNIATNGVHFAAFDGNGNVNALVSTTSGARTANYEYSPFGETLRVEGVVANANPIRFSTQFADELTGNLKYLLRVYQPSFGNWFSRDPIEEDGGVRLYGFVLNNAVMFADLFGLRLNIKSEDLSVEEIMRRRGPAKRGYTEADASPTPKLNDEVVESQNSGCYCAEVKSAEEIVLDVRQYLPDRSSIGKYFTAEGWKLAIDHENKRLRTIKLGFETFIEPVELKGKVALQCGKICSSKPGEAKKQLEDWLTTLHRNAIRAYISYVVAQNLGISGENRHWNIVNGVITDLAPEHRFTVTPPQALSYPPCPNAGGCN